MTRIARLLALSLLSLVFVPAFLHSRGAAAAGTFAVSVAPAEDVFAVGSLAVFRVRVEGQTANLPSFDYNVEGGTLAGVASIDPTAANVAEGAVFVSRENEGTARLTVSLAGGVLATAQARFARLGEIHVTVTLGAGPDAAARTWRYEVLNTSGQVVASLSANTSGDAPSDTVTTPYLPHGFYTVRQVLGNDTRTACAPGAFYAVSAPVSGETTLDLAGPSTGVSFTIVPCPDLPAGLNVLIPIDTLAPSTGVVGDAERVPGATPISEVRGAREVGPGNIMPPAAGNSELAVKQGSNVYLLLLVTGAAATLLPLAAWSAAAARGARGD